MSNTVFVKSGEQPRYFAFSGNLSTTSAVASSPIYKDSPYSSFQAIVTGTGAVTATVVIQATNEEATRLGTSTNWINIGTISLSGTTTATDGFTTIAPWRAMRANVTGVTGTSAAVSVIMGV